MKFEDVLTGKRQLTKEEAIAFSKTKWWDGLRPSVIATLLINQERMCTNFSTFHRAFEEALGRPVWTHEFAFRDRLRDELFGKKPTMREILELVPEEKGLFWSVGADDGLLQHLQRTGNHRHLS